MLLDSEVLGLQAALLMALVLAGLAVFSALPVLIRLWGEFRLVEAVPHQRWPRSSAEAGLRRSALSELLSDLGRREYRETPEGFRPTGRELNAEEAAAQRAYFRWQLEDPAYLLLGRITETIRSAFDEKPSSGTYARVSLKAVRRAKGYFPFEVIVETDRLGVVKAALRSWTDRVGVRVRIGPAVVGKYHSRGTCLASEREGPAYVGGYLAAGDGSRVGVTCAHAIGDGCHSQLFRARLHNLPAVCNEPDIALLRRDSRCFQPLTADLNIPVLKFSSADLHYKRRVKLVPGWRSAGEIERVATSAGFEDRLHFFPHVVIQPLRDRRFFGLFEISPRRFSVRGDSGSWVVTEEGTEWVGVLVGGHSEARTSDAIQASVLLDFISGLTAYSQFKTPFIEEPPR